MEFIDSPLFDGPQSKIHCPMVTRGSHFWIYCFIVMSVYEKYLRLRKGWSFRNTRHGMYVKLNTETYSCKRWCSGKAISITYSERMSAALVTSMHSTCAVLSSVASLAVPYFSTLAHNSLDFRKSYWTFYLCFDFVYNFVWNISHSKKNSTTWCHKCM
jgi:hypothetical protein